MIPRAFRTLPRLPAVLLAAGQASSGAQEPGYVADIKDLPLMPGLRELPDAAMVFDKPEGRIVETYAQGAVSRAAVESFDRDSLPRLGWRRLGDLSFAREGERLTIEIVAGASPLTLRITLRPD